jgi:GxxExxY protein
MDSQQPTLKHEDITGVVIKAFFDVYNELAGFPEFVLCRAMAIAIRDAGLSAAEEVPLPVWFRGHQIVKFKADLIVQSQVIVEVKARPEVDPFNKAQVLHYLKATDMEVGLLLNFGRRPEFSRVIYENARKSPRHVPPADAESEKPA